METCLNLSSTAWHGTPIASENPCRISHPLAISRTLALRNVSTRALVRSMAGSKGGLQSNPLAEVAHISPARRPGCAASTTTNRKLLTPSSDVVRTQAQRLQVSNGSCQRLGTGARHDHRNSSSNLIHSCNPQYNASYSLPMLFLCARGWLHVRAAKGNRKVGVCNACGTTLNFLFG